MKPNLLTARRVTCPLVLGLLVGPGAASAATLRLDTLMAVLDVPSPCLSVRVKIMEEGQPRAEVAVMPSGKVNPIGDSGAPLPSFVKGRTYKLGATCISTSRVFQNTELTFKADGRTVMVVFTKSGFQFRRGSLAY